MFEHLEAPEDLGQGLCVFEAFSTAFLDKLSWKVIGLFWAQSFYEPCESNAIEITVALAEPDMDKEKRTQTWRKRSKKQVLF
jgi:hypothetical protein